MGFHITRLNGKLSCVTIVILGEMVVLLHPQFSSAGLFKLLRLSVVSPLLMLSSVMHVVFIVTICIIVITIKSVIFRKVFVFKGRITIDVSPPSL